MQDGDKLYLSFNGERVSENYIIPDEEIKYHVEVYNRNADDGYIRVYRNRVIDYEYKGDMNVDSAEQWYFKIGCYIWLSPPHRPIETQWAKNYKKVYFRL
jgi:hypothetical protein